MSSSLGALGSLPGKLRSLLVSSKNQLPDPLKDEVKLLIQDLEEARNLLVDLSGAEPPESMVKLWRNEVREMSYDLEDYIDKTTHPSSNQFEAEEFGTLLDLARDACKSYHRYHLGRLWPSNPSSLASGHGLVPKLNREAKYIVGIDDARHKLISWLRDDAEQQLKVVPILGPAGVGKTTLAQEVYREIGGEYHCRAFVRASRMPDTRRLLRSIISQIRRRQPPPYGCTVQMLIDCLSEHLQYKRICQLLDLPEDSNSSDIEGKCLESQQGLTNTIPKELPADFMKETTSDLSPGRVLGCSAFGTVSKGTLAEGGMIAVKTLADNSPVKQGKIFHTEAESPSASAGGGASNNVMAAAQAAQHSVTSIGTSMNAATDKNFVLSDSDSSLAFDTAEELILLRDATSEALVFETTNEDDVAQYLAAVDVVVDHLACGDARAARAEVAVQLAMVRLEEEFRHLMLRHAMTQDYMTFFSSLRDTVRASVEYDTSSLFSSRCETLSSIKSDTTSWVESEEDLDALSVDFDATTPHSMEAAFDDQVFDPVRPGAVDELFAIANRMARAGYVRGLAKAYCDVRRDLIDEFLSTLGVEHLSVNEVQRMDWQHLQDRMKKWVQEVKTIVPVLLAGERRFCDEVLAVSDKLREECFFESTKGCIMRILNFGDAVAGCTRSPEKVMRILDMYEALTGMIPAVKNLWLGSSGYCVIRDVQAILDRLGDAVRGILFEFEKAVQQESSRRLIPAGVVHPMTRYVMNYLRLLVSYGETLDVLLGNHSDDQNASQDQEHMEGITPLGRCLMKLISYLEANLKEKSKLYEDAALGCIFAMNNYLYIVQKVKDSEVGKILGDSWIKGLRDKIKHYSQSYLRISWAKVLSYLYVADLRGSSGSEGGSGSGHSISRMSIKSKFKSFNMAFEEIYRNQTCWIVPDPELRVELQVAISVNVVQAYRTFMAINGMSVGKNPGKYIKYTPEDLENQISDLFQGIPRPGSAKTI